MSTVTLGSPSTLGVLARQEIRNYLRHKLFWFGTALIIVVTVFTILNLDSDPSSASLYAIAPAALLGVLGLVTMFGLTRRSDRAAEAAGAVAVPERTRTLALAVAVVVPFTVALVTWVVAVLGLLAHPPAPETVPPGVSSGYVYAQMFGDGVLSAVGGPLLGLLLARYLPKRGVAALASVLLVLVTILLQGNFAGGQPYRVFWVWTYFVGPLGWGPEPDGLTHWKTAPGNPYFWLVYLAVLCVLGIVLAVRHDPESQRARLTWSALALVVVAAILGVLSMTVGFSEAIVNPVPCVTCA
jgi:FtsH-binding integral membrane protein